MADPRWWETDAWVDWPDARVVAMVGDVVAEPRAEPADSFVLHAPLELAARAALLASVEPAARAIARDRIVDIAREYDAFGPSVPVPPARAFTYVGSAARRLVDAIAAGDLAEVDAVAVWLGRVARPDELATLLADAALPLLGAAAHAPIFLYQLPRVAPRGELGGELLRGLARELARAPEWRLAWPAEHTEAASADGGADALFEAVAATPRLGIPGSTFIYPLMSQVERTGLAPSLLAPAIGTGDFEASARALLRAAAWSMLQEPPDHAPYGWSHALTMPQAVLGLARALPEPSVAVAVAATYLVGFRAALAERPLEARGPAPMNRGEHRARITELATSAASHPDAHLVKYTLACIDAAAFDAEYAGWYLDAAGRLVDVWSGRAEQVASG